MTIDSNNINKGLEHIKTPYSDRQLKSEISGLKSIIHAHCYGILPTLQEVSKIFNKDNKFVELYKTLRGESLKLSDLADQERKSIVKFAYPIRLYEKAKRAKSTGEVESFEIGARLGIDTLTQNGFVPALIFENGSKVDIKYYPDDHFIKYMLYKELNPNTSKLDFLKEVVKSLNYWDNHKEFDAGHRIIKRFEDTYKKIS